jgi:membrane protease subunit (stomatin/prohibitin family)
LRVISLEQFMSLKSFFSKQFIDVLQWNEDGAGVLAYRYPMADLEIRNGAALTVRETQRALFVNEGRVADLFGPGLYQLTTHTLPVLTYLQNWDKLFESPFKSDVFFFSIRDQVDQRWGTPQPITVRDKEFGALRIRANGVYSYRIADPGLFWTRLSGTVAQYSVADAEGQLRAAILTSMAASVGSSDVAFLDMAANQEKFSASLKQAIEPTFAGYGLELTSFYLQSLSLPEEVQARLDRSSAMHILGDMKQYTQFEAAESLREAAANPGGVAGAGAGLGAGLAMAQAFGGALNAAPAAAAAVSGQPVSDPVAMIERLGGLLQKGILTQAEFDAKKAELLQQIR